MLNQGDVLTLNDNKKYSVVYVKQINNKNYVYLIDQDDYTNSMICEYDNNTGLEEVNDSEIVELLLKEFSIEQNN